MKKILYLTVISIMVLQACHFNDHLEPREEVDAPWWRSLYFYGFVNDTIFHVPPDTVSYLFEAENLKWEDTGYHHVVYRSNIASPGMILNLPEFEMQFGPAKYLSDSITDEEFFAFFREGSYDLIRGEDLIEGVIMEFTFLDSLGNMRHLATNEGGQPDFANFEVISTRTRVVVDDTGTPETRMYIRARFNCYFWDTEGNRAYLQDGEVVTYFVK